MPQRVNVSPAEVKVGDEVTVWRCGGGQGGFITALDTEAITVTWMGVSHDFQLDTIDGLEIERPWPVDACLEYGDDCRGEVELFSPDGRGSSYPRCEHHTELRAKRFQESVEAYAYSDVAPPGVSWMEWTGGEE